MFFTAVMPSFAVANKSELSTFSPLSPLSITVERIKQKKGQLHYQLFSCPVNKEVSWEELTLMQSGQSVISQTELSFTLNSLDTGRYIVRVFQDINDNQQLDYASNGIPKEPFGFSTNPSVMLGQPMAIDVCFSHPLTEAATEALTEPLPEVLMIKLNNKKKRKKRKRH